MSNMETQPFTETQRLLLGLFSREMSLQEQNDIKELLLDYYDNLLQKEVQKAIQEKGYTNADIEQVLQNSQRTKR
jgi:hypothetical protein